MYLLLCVFSCVFLCVCVFRCLFLRVFMYVFTCFCDYIMFKVNVEIRKY